MPWERKCALYSNPFWCIFLFGFCLTCIIKTNIQNLDDNSNHTGMGYDEGNPKYFILPCINPYWAYWKTVRYEISGFEIQKGHRKLLDVQKRQEHKKE